MPLSEDTSPSRARLFVAATAGAPLREWLRPRLEALRRALPAVRWTRPESLHVTLRFLGDTPRARSGEVLDALARAGAGVAPQRLSVGDAGGFGPARAPRVLWLGFRCDEDARRTGALVARIEAALAALGFAPADGGRRSWTPHLTLGRNGRGAALPGWRESLAAALAPADAAPFLAVDRIELYESRLDRGGAVHVPLGSVGLGALS